MSEDKLSNRESAKNNAQEAMEKAKAFVDEGMTAFNKLDSKLKIYMAAAVVMLATVFVFPVYSYDYGKEMEDNLVAAREMGRSLGVEIPKQSAYQPKFSVVRTSPGWLVGLAALATVGVSVVYLVGKRKEAWLPIARVAAPGLATLGLLIVLISSPSGGLAVDIDRTIFGFWLPFATAIAATAIAVQRLMGAQVSSQN